MIAAAHLRPDGFEPPRSVYSNYDGASGVTISAGVSQWKWLSCRPSKVHSAPALPGGILYTAAAAVPLASDAAAAEAACAGAAISPAGADAARAAAGTADAPELADAVLAAGVSTEPTAASRVLCAFGATIVPSTTTREPCAANETLLILSGNSPTSL